MKQKLFPEAISPSAKKNRPIPSPPPRCPPPPSPFRSPLSLPPFPATPGRRRRLGRHAHTPKNPNQRSIDTESKHQRSRFAVTCRASEFRPTFFHFFIKPLSTNSTLLIPFCHPPGDAHRLLGKTAPGMLQDARAEILLLSCPRRSVAWRAANPQRVSRDKSIMHFTTLRTGVLGQHARMPATASSSTILPPSPPLCLQRISHAQLLRKSHTWLSSIHSRPLGAYFPSAKSCASSFAPLSGFESSPSSLSPPRGWRT